MKGAHRDTLGLLRLGVWESPIPYCIYPDSVWLGGHRATRRAIVISVVKSLISSGERAADRILRSNPVAGVGDDEPNSSGKAPRDPCLVVSSGDRRSTTDGDILFCTPRGNKRA